jgi:predicted ATPase
LHPISDWGRQRFGSADVPAEKRLADLENLLEQLKLHPRANAVLLAPLLDIRLPQERILALPPEELRRRQLAALTSLVITGARAQPVVLTLEDLHWADPTTLDLVRGITERGASAPLFVLITARPEFRPAWGMRSHHSTISLAPLDRAQVRHMVGELAARHALPTEVIDGLTERTGGVPLFVEEVTRLLLERGEHGGIQAIPPTLQQSLMARLDRLGPAREVAQIGAVIGRDFRYSLLGAVTGMDDTPLQAALDRLIDADILLAQGLPPDADYRFKHALIQDAAYENLLKSRRQVLHRRLGEALRDKFAGTAAAEPELLAHHFTQAGMTEAAIEWWGKAGQRSLERSALVEATVQLTRALDQIVHIPSTPSLRREEIKLQVALINPLLHVKGYAAPETKAAAERARLLIEQAEGARTVGSGLRVVH